MKILFLEILISISLRIHHMVVRNKESQESTPLRRDFETFHSSISQEKADDLKADSRKMFLVEREIWSGITSNTT